MEVKIMNEMFKDYPDVVTVQQMREMLNIGLGNAYELVRSNIIKSRKIGATYRIPKRYIIDFILAA